MNFLQKLFSRAIPPGPPLTWDYFMRDGMESLSGITVSESTILNHSPVWSGVFQLSGDIAKLPLSHNRVLPNGGKQVFDGNGGRLHYVLHDRPNPEMTSFKFRETMQALCLLYGNAYAEIVRDSLGRVAGLYPLSPTRVTPVREDRTLPDGRFNPRVGRLLYRVSQPSGGQVYVLPENMIHISSLSTDGIIGHSVTEHARESVGVGMAAEKFGAAFFGNGATFGGVVEVPMTLQGPTGQTVKDNIRAAIEAVHAGVERAHKILVLAGGSKFTQRGTAPNEAQFIETRKFQIQEVSRWLVMPPHKLSDLENAHFTNIEESELQYWKGTVHRWLKMWEQELRVKLIPSLEQNQQSIDFNMEGELRGTSAQRAAFYKEMHGLGVYTVNMILEKESLPTIGPDGDRRLVAMNNAIPLDRLDEYVDSVIKKNEPPPALPPKEEPKQLEEGDGERILKAIEETRAEAAKLAEQMRVKLEQEVTEHATTAAEAKRAQAEAETVATAAEAARVQAEDAARVARESEAAARLELQSANERLTQAIGAKDGAEATAAERQTAIDSALADVAAKSEALSNAQAAATTAAAEAQEHRQKAEAAEATAHARTAEAEQLRAELTAATEARDAASARAAAAEAAVEERRQAEQARLSRVVTAHRALVLDVIQRIARTEAERARRRAASPEALRKWAEAFYDESGRDICAEMLFPAVQTHLAWKGSDEDPRAVARAMADEYYGESARQIRTICDGMVGDEYQAAVTRMLTRWEQERPALVADKVVRDEIAVLANR